jgi:hypothetical protein
MSLPCSIMKSKKTESRPRVARKVKDPNKLNKRTSHPLLDEILEVAIKLLKARF